MRTEFNTQIADCLSAAPTGTNFDPSDLTPDCIYYEDDESSYQEGTPDEILPTPEGNNNYVNVEIMLPRGEEMAMGELPRGLVTQTATHWVMPMTTPFSTLVSTLSNLLTEMRLNWQPTLSLLICMRSVILVGTSMFYLIP